MMPLTNADIEKLEVDHPDVMKEWLADHYGDNTELMHNIQYVFGELTAPTFAPAITSGADTSVSTSGATGAALDGMCAQLDRLAVVPLSKIEALRDAEVARAGAERARASAEETITKRAEFEFKKEEIILQRERESRAAMSAVCGSHHGGAAKRPFNSDTTTGAADGPAKCARLSSVSSGHAVVSTDPPVHTAMRDAIDKYAIDHPTLRILSPEIIDTHRGVAQLKGSSYRDQSGGAHSNGKQRNGGLHRYTSNFKQLLSNLIIGPGLKWFNDNCRDCIAELWSCPYSSL